MSGNTQFIDNPSLLCLTGSRLYGTARYNELGECISDEDLRGFVLPPLDYLIGIQQFHEGERDGDHKVYSLQKFLSMLIKGNAQALECMFAPQSHIIRIDEIGKKIRESRSLYVGKHYFKAITGFAYSEWAKAIGLKQIPVERNLDEKKALDTFRNAFKNLSKQTWDDMLMMAYSEHERKTVDSKQDLGAKRKAEFDKFGYCVTSAHHAIRLLYQCEELLLHGILTFPRPESATLSSIKRGEVSLTEAEKLHDDLMQRADRAYGVSKIPERADVKALNAIYREIVLDYLRAELREDS